jgi:two-component system OmpR family sensor kinase
VLVAGFVYVQLRADLTEVVDTALRARIAAGVYEGEPEEGYLDTTGRRGVTTAEQTRAASGEVIVEREVAGIDGRVRVLARGGAVAGQTLDDRDEALGALTAAFLVGGPIAVLLASLVGYALAASALRPIEAMRRRAAEVSLRREEEPLPLPAARDEVRALGETLNDMLDRLRRSFQRERQFVADASHELRTPVAVLKTELEGALRTGDFGPSVREALEAAVEECDHLAQLAEDLLVIARAGGGQLPVRPERLDARNELLAARERYLDRAERAGRAIEVQAPDGFAPRADPLRLRQMLGNLVDNALRHGAGDVVLVAEESPGGLAIEVRDGGAGFAADIAGQAFERFTRGDAARTRGGAGLGLAIVRAVAEAHGGQAEIVAGEGGRVRVVLPSQERLSQPSYRPPHEHIPSHTRTAGRRA